MSDREILDKILSALENVEQELGNIFNSVSDVEDRLTIVEKTVREIALNTRR